MRRLVFIAISYLSLFFTNIFAQDMIVDSCSIQLDTREFSHPYSQVSVSEYVKYKGIYFIALEEKIMGETALAYNHIVAYSPSDGKTELVYKPYDLRFNNIEPLHNGLFVRNDSLIVGKVYEKNRFLCIERNTIDSWSNDSIWMVKEAKEPSNIIFEDKHFTIKHTDFGEWGKYLSFVDKRNKHAEHLYRTNAIHIFKLDDGYYLPMKYSMGYIANPHEGKVQTIDGVRDLPSSEPEIIFDIADGQDDFWLVEEPDTLYSHFFLRHGKIHALAMTSEEVSVAVFENGKYHNIQSLGTIPLNAPNTIIDIRDNTISIISINCKTETPPLSDSISIEQSIQFFAERGIGNTKMLEAIKFLHNDGSVTNNHPTTHIYNANLSRLIFMTYALPKYSLQTSYLYNTASGIIKGAVLEIQTTPTSMGGEIPDYKVIKTNNGKKSELVYILPVIPEEEKRTIAARIEEEMIKLLGKPTEQTSNSIVWILPNGVRFRFHAHNLRIWIDNKNHPVSAI